MRVKGRGRKRTKLDEYGERLAKWLNSPGADRSMIAELLEDLLLLLRDTDRARSRDQLRGGPEHVELKEIREEIDQKFLRRFHPEIVIADLPLEDGRIPFGLRPPQDTGEVTLQQYNAFLDIFELARNAQIGRLVRCDICDRWLFSKSPYGEKLQRRHPGKCEQIWDRVSHAVYNRHKRSDERFSSNGLFRSVADAPRAIRSELERELYGQLEREETNGDI